jgi:hypothetical protein
MADGGGFNEQIRPGKSLITGDQIAPGAINLSHLSQALFAEFRQISLHNHSGVKTRQIDCADLTGSFNKTGIPVRSPNGHIWHIVVDNSGVVTAT